MKLFFIGFNKTGTSTYYELFKTILQSTHNIEWCEVSNNNDKKSFMEYFKRYDCYSDGQLANYQRLDDYFPESKFILNTRGLYDWLFSLIKHIENLRKTRITIHDNWYISKEYINSNDKMDIIIKWIKKRNKYHKKCIKYFTYRSNFLILNINDKNLYTKLSDFTKLPISNENIVANEGSSSFTDDEIITIKDLIIKAFEKLNIKEEDYNIDTFLDYID